MISAPGYLLLSKRNTASGRFTPVRYDDFQIGLPMAGTLKEILNSDDERFGGSGVKNPGAVRTRRKPFLDMQHSARIVLPPMSCVYYEFKPRKK